MLARFGPTSFVLAFAISIPSLAAQHDIPLTQDTVNGDDMGIQPGDVICIQAGKREFLVLENIVGTQTAPVVIKNCGGKVEIANDDRGYGININGSSFFHLTGTGDPAIEYGFDVIASRTGPDYSGSGVPVGGLSTDYEIDHIEVRETGFAGFILKTESRCDGTANLGNFVQKNTRVHHTYVHDTGGEGFYVGSTGYGGREFDCNGVPTILYPHEHDGVYLHHNIIENTGWDGLQVGVTPKNCEVNHNRIVGVGKTATDMVQTRGIQIGGASACKIFGNYLADGPTIGIFVLGAANTEVSNNVVANFAEDGIYGNDQELDAVTGSSYLFLHNTVVNSGETGLSLFGDRISGNAVGNNLFVASASPHGIGGNVDAIDEGNLELATLAEAGFVDGEAGDFHLLIDSVAKDQGVMLAGFTVETDLDGVPRDSTPDVGSYEYTDAPPPTDGGLPGGGGGSSSGGSGGQSSGGSSASGSSDDGGCGCRTTAGGHGLSSWITLVLGLFAFVRRRTR
jgi:MYXO-CTERM domain-containing protein